MADDVTYSTPEKRHVPPDEHERTQRGIIIVSSLLPGRPPADAYVIASSSGASRPYEEAPGLYHLHPLLQSCATALSASTRRPMWLVRCSARPAHPASGETRGKTVQLWSGGAGDGVHLLEKHERSRADDETERQDEGQGAVRSRLRCAVFKRDAVVFAI